MMRNSIQNHIQADKNNYYSLIIIESTLEINLFT